MTRPPGFRLGVLLAAFLALGAGPSRPPGDDPLEPPDLGRYLRWGPLRVRPGFTVKNAGYDNNVFFSTVGEPQVGDYRITFAPRVEGLLLFGNRAFFEFDWRFDYTVYRELSSQNFGNNFFRSRVTVPFGKVGFVTNLDLFRLNDRATSELDTRLKRNERLLGVGFVFKLGWRTYADLQHVVETFDYEDPDVATDLLLNRVESGPQLTFDYRVTGKTRLTAELVWKRIDFDEPAVDRDARQLSTLVGARFGEGGRIGGFVKVGWEVIDLDDPAKVDYDGPVGEGEIGFRAGRGTTIRLGGWRRVGFAVWNLNNFYLDTRGSLTINHFFNRSFGIEGRVADGELTFPSSTPPVRVDHITEYEGRIIFRLHQSPLGQQLEYFLGWRRYLRISDPPYQSLNQTRDTIGLGVNYGF